ncbi:hypothetical protein SAMN05216480_12710 [Pustulibacterium marinum]|uniref:Tetratricopeptide repeat-containing protein n=1 Tax=Pustulibacterium marinum TaxID=1224947 RepID=A0A1I7IZY4_9FLAO|nr:hypothetical protein [Pustulibacterium marinum]SFU78452.1 hypothetical protein SAMN05216480_12710 [Pustulibacterium marinum]
MKKPELRFYGENEWEFVYPASIDNATVYNAYWSGVELLDYEDSRAENIFKKLIAKHPYFLDAYNHLSIAFRNQNKTFESWLTAEKSYSLGKSILPETFIIGKHKIHWGVLENRGFLRACQQYGLECQYHKDYEKAKSVYLENLSYNQEDHQGIRYLLLEVYLAHKKLKEARELINKYSKDYSIEFAFTSVALEVLAGNYEKANAKLLEAIKINKHFVAEVIKEQHQKPPVYRLPGEPFFDAGIPIGSVQQAYEYWKRNKVFYAKKELIAYFKENALS